MTNLIRRIKHIFGIHYYVPEVTTLPTGMEFCWYCGKPKPDNPAPPWENLP